MKEITNQSMNNVNIVGKLINTTFREGKTSEGKPYESVTFLVRVTQDVDGKQETSEISTSIFASQYTNSGKANPLYEGVQKAKELKTAQNVGIDAADMVRLSRANLQENFYTAKNGQFYDGWQIRGSFCSKAPSDANEIASFTIEAFILDMRDEMNREGEPTGRMIIKAGIVQYGGKLDVVELIVEDPDKVDYLQRNWEVNQTVKIVGRIRVKSEETKKMSATSSWGEVLPEETTKLVRELIVTGGSDEAYEEEVAYDPMDIKKAFNVRKALIEQKQNEAVAKSNTTTKKSAGKYDWE